jgi:hypothetical protein
VVGVQVRFHIKEQVLRLVILIAVYWLIFVYLIFYRVYIEVVLVPPPAHDMTRTILDTHTHTHTTHAWDTRHTR